MSTSQGSSRTVGLIALVAVYVAVSAIAYTDHPRPATEPPLTQEEQVGLSVWRTRNCQACHQLHGFGGFFGPDLTNRMTETTADEEVLDIVASGNGRMPAFDLSFTEQAGLVAYLRAVNRTGRSVPSTPPQGKVVPRVEHFTLLAAEWEAGEGRQLTPDARRGSAIWTRTGCGSCHLPLQTGRVLSPDVTVAAIDRSPAALSALLAKGRRRMPAFALSAAEIADLSAFLDWSAANRPALVRANLRLLEQDGFRWSGLPWFEYR